MSELRNADNVEVVHEESDVNVGAILKYARARQEGADWAAEYAESAEAAVAASELEPTVRFLEELLADAPGR